MEEEWLEKFNNHNHRLTADAGEAQEGEMKEKWLEEFNNHNHQLTLDAGDGQEGDNQII